MCDLPWDRVKKVRKPWKLKEGPRAWRLGKKDEGDGTGSSKEPWSPGKPLTCSKPGWGWGVRQEQVLLKNDWLLSRMGFSGLIVCFFLMDTVTPIHYIKGFSLLTGMEARVEARDGGAWGKEEGGRWAGKRLGR